MSEAAAPQPLVVGIPAEWEHLQKAHPEFLAHLPRLVGLANRAFEAAGDMKEIQDRVIHGLTRTCFEELMEVLTLCGNGYGIGGLKLVRTMYENAVTARYLHLRPDEVDKFMNYFFVASKKLIDAVERETGEPTSPELRAQADREYERVKQQYEVELCSNCKRRGMNFRWSKLDFVAMATKTKGLDELIVPAYLNTLQFTHAGAVGLLSRLEGNREEVSYRGTPQREEAASALHLANAIALRSIGYYCDHFKLDTLYEELKACIDEHNRIWADKQPPQPGKSA